MKCYGCKHHTLGCHGWCEVYMAYRSEVDAANELRAKENAAIDLLASGSAKRQNRFQRGVGHHIKIGGKH